MNNHMKELVVAKYKEDINWINECSTIDKVTVYDKDEESESLNKLLNVGREGNTYLHHIIKNYSNLAPYTIFCQGDPSFHDHHFVEKINTIDSIIHAHSKKGYYFFSTEARELLNETIHEKHPIGLPISYFLDLLFDIKISQKIQITYNCSAQFLVKKENILNRPKKFYEFLLSFLSSEKDPIEGYVFERIWKFILDKNIKHSSKYKKFNDIY